MLSFRIFDLEADSQCRYDYLDVYNGNSNLVQKLGRFCGTFRPGALISTTNTMMLEMVSDEETHGRGFVAYFSGTKPYVDGTWASDDDVILSFFKKMIVSCIQMSLIPNRGGLCHVFCSPITPLLHNVFSSPALLSQYLDEQHHFFIVQLLFDFHHRPASERIQQTVVLGVHSDVISSPAPHGVSLFALDQQFCGGKITKAQGEIKTPNWPEKKYPAGTSCSWLITVEPDMVCSTLTPKHGTLLMSHLVLNTSV